MINKQYIPIARDQYPNWDTLDELQQQRVLNSLYSEHRRTDPREAERLRQAQYRVTKRQKSESLSERITYLEKRIQTIEEYVDKCIAIHDQDIADLKRRLIIPDMGV